MSTTGPVADKAREEKAKTESEFRNVANSRKTPTEPAATGQPLTHYHSMFYNILSVGLDFSDRKALLTFESGRILA